MAVIILTGVAGTGKTLYAIQKYIIPSLKMGETVYTNIDGLISSRIACLFGIEFFDVEKNLHIISNVQYFYKEVSKNSLIIIDEAQNIFSNRDWQSPVNSQCVNYLMEHRHFGHRIVFITPAVDNLDAGIRRVAELTYKHKSFSILGNVKSVRCGIFDQCNITKEPMQVFSWKHDSRVYDCYKSYFEENTKEKKPRVYPLRNFTLILLFLFSFLMLFFAIKNGSKFAKRFIKNKNEIVVIDKGYKKNRPVIMINDSLVNIK